MLGIIRWLQGYVRFAVLGARPGEAFTAAGRAGAAIFGVEEREGLLTAACSVGDYRRLTRALRRQNRRRPQRRTVTADSAAPGGSEAQQSKVEETHPPAEAWWEAVLKAQEGRKEKPPENKLRRAFRRWGQRMIEQPASGVPGWVIGRPILRKRQRFRGLRQALSLCRVRAEVRDKNALSLRVVSRHGPRFTVHRYRKRPGIPVGLVLAAALLLVLRGFIWDVTVEGNERLPAGVYLDTLEELGLRPGVRRCDIPTLHIVQQTALTHSEIGWMAINLVGCRAYVEIREQVEAPVPLEKNVPCNLVASEDAQVVSLEAFGGQKAVQPGDWVRKGQLLVSGVFTDFSGGSHLVHAWGEVQARVTRTLTVEVPMAVTVYKSTDVVTGYTLRLGNAVLPLSAPPGGSWVSAEQITPLSVWGVRLPGELITTQWVRMQSEQREYTEGDARARAERMLEKKIDLLVGEDTLESQQQVGYPQDGVYRLEAKLVILRDIAREQEIFVSSAPSQDPSGEEAAPPPEP